MDREYTNDKVPGRLVQRIKAVGNGRRFRRRAVLTKANAKWELLCCTVEAFLPDATLPERVTSREYSQAILFEDFLTAKECLKFTRDLQDGNVSFGGIQLQRSQNTHWSAELLPVNNDYMTRAGYVVSLPFATGGGRASVRTLLAVKQPYYPDADGAARDWLPLRVYHGDRDSRNDHVHFLLPEIRAYIADAAFSGERTLVITIAGTKTSTLSLLVKGAYWEGKALHHVEAPVADGRAALAVPEGADRFEYFLIDGEAVVYDYRREDQFSRQSRATPGSIERTLQDQVRKACQSGEGLRIEFKPFIEIADKRSPKEDVIKRGKQNPKLREVVETAAALANAEGGHIYLGVNDDCTISGIGEALREWAKQEIGDAAIDRYFGALRNRIKELLHGEVALAFSHVEIDGMLVGIIEVSQGAHGPVALQQEFHLYIRSGASNRKAPPEQWKSILKADKPHGMF